MPEWEREFLCSERGGGKGITVSLQLPAIYKVGRGGERTSKRGKRNGKRANTLKVIKEDSSAKKATKKCQELKGKEKKELVPRKRDLCFGDKREVLSTFEGGDPIKKEGPIQPSRDFTQYGREDSSRGGEEKEETGPTFRGEGQLGWDRGEKEKGGWEIGDRPKRICKKVLIGG